MFKFKSTIIKGLKADIDYLKAGISGQNKELVSLREDKFKLTVKLKKAEGLESVLLKLTDTKQSFEGMVAAGGCIAYKDIKDDIEAGLSDNIPRYVKDLFGGKVIKQEANKAIKISKAGFVETGVTRETCDKGRTYKLIQE